MKKCIKCNVEKPISEYHVNKTKKDTYKTCKSCVDKMEKDYIRIHMDKNGDYIYNPVYQKKSK